MPALARLVQHSICGIIMLLLLLLLLLLQHAFRQHSAPRLDAGSMQGGRHQTPLRKAGCVAGALLTQCTGSPGTRNLSKELWVWRTRGR